MSDYDDDAGGGDGGNDGIIVMTITWCLLHNGVANQMVVMTQIVVLPK